MKILWVTPYGERIKDGLATYSRSIVQDGCLADRCLVTVLPWNFQKKIKRFLHPIPVICRLVRQMFRYDVVHVQYVPGLFLYHLIVPLMLARAFGRPVVVLTLHEKVRPGDSFFRKALLHLHMRLAPALVVHSKDHLQSLGKFRHKSVLIPHVVRLPIASEHRSRDPHMLLIPGFINPWKGAHTLIAMMGLLRHSHPQVKLYIVGGIHNEGYYQKLRTMAAQKNLEDVVVFRTDFEPSREYWNMLGTAQLVLLPYQHITMSGVLNDAIAAGTPFLLSDIAPFREIAGAAAPHICVPSHDPDEWARRVSHVLDEAEALQQISAHCRTYKERRSPRAIARAHNDLYQSLVS